MFASDVSHWWESMCCTRSESEQDGLTWSQFKEELMEKYFLQALRDNKETEFLKLRQGNMLLPEYEQKFEQLSKYAPHLVDTEAKKIKRFEQGLSIDMSLILPFHSFTSYREMQAWAKTIWYCKASVDQSAPQNKDFIGKRKWSGQDKGKIAKKEVKYRIQQRQARSLRSTLPKM
ncbi:Pepsin-retropepsin like protein [Abeliophyllum distichum]|uniref:Pepsin-retropepsin like protein n=1 Tax=Abeliophyllum distichum TaxID=126358 RepID=A0ABD1Q5N2_9LAMI